MVPDEGALIRQRSSYLAGCTLLIPVLLWTIYTLNCRVTIDQEYIKIKYPTCMGFFPKVVKYDDIEKVEIKRYEGKKPHYQYHFFLKNSHKDKYDFAIASGSFLKRERIEKALSELALMINSKNTLENLENKEDQALPTSETINN